MYSRLRWWCEQDSNKLVSLRGGGRDAAVCGDSSCCVVSLAMLSTMARHVAAALCYAILLAVCGMEARQSCCFGKTRLAHGETALTLKRCCVSFMCNNGDIETVYFGNPETGECHEEDKHPYGRQKYLYPECKFDGQIYPNGTKLLAHCSGLICVNGQWEATGIIEDCCAHCFLFNTHHVYTFDDNLYIWGSPCNYSVVQTGLTHHPKVAIFSSFGSCFNTNSQPYCLQQTTFRNDPYTVITLMNEPGDAIFDILVNGNAYTVPDNVVQEVRSSPVLIHPVLAWRELGCVFLLGSSGLMIKYCLHRMDVWAFPTLSSTPDSLHGLCGHFNFYPSDDMTARDGIVYPVSTYPLAFPESWRTLEQSHPRCSSPMPNIYSSPTTSDSCVASATKKQEYHAKCSQFLHPVLGLDTELKFHVDACERDLCLMDQGGVSETEQRMWLIEMVKITQHSKLLLAQIKGVFVPHPLFAPLEGFCVAGSSWTQECNRCGCTESRSVPVCTLISCTEDFLPKLGGEFCTNGSRWRISDCNLCVCINKGIVCSFDECSSTTLTVSTFSTLPPSFVCGLRPEPGLCDPVLQWYYDFESGRCSQFFSTHCGANHNKFDTKEDCEAMCGFLTTSRTVTPATPVPLLCYMRWDAGTCREAELKYYYAPSTGTCIPAYYSGLWSDTTTTDTTTTTTITASTCPPEMLICPQDCGIKYIIDFATNCPRSGEAVTCELDSASDSMKVQVLLLLLGAAVAAATSPPFVELPDGLDAAECEGQPLVDRWRKDCNWCSCNDGKARCSRRLCAEGVQDPEPQCEGSPTWKNDCNTCRCAGGRAVCTAKQCGQVDPQQQVVEVQVENAECEDGSRWRVECNWCVCQGGKSLCTEINCDDWNEAQAQEEGILECHGTSRWKKDCNWCGCANGRGFCTKRGCVQTGPFANLAEDAVCVPGSRWLVDCNWCGCSDDGRSSFCTLMACIPGYVHEGRTCDEGSLWKTDDCNICRCINGVSACTKRLCATPHQEPRKPQVSDEPECQGDPSTDRWRQDCNWCSCRNGVGACSRRLCAEGEEDDQPECEGNPSWMKDCNRCTCVDGRAVCTTKFCGPLLARPAIATVHRTPVGPLGPALEPVCQGNPDTAFWFKDCNRCRCVNGVAACSRRLCRPGEVNSPRCGGNASWKKDCNHCHCSNGTAVCTTKFCGVRRGPAQSRGGQAPVMQISKPVCEDGSRWRVDCNWCTCHNGMALCTKRACIDENDVSGPECEGDATWKRDCNWCTCGDGMALCTRMACLKEVKKPCVEGTSWRNGCNICRCSHGFVLCTKKGCPQTGRQIPCQGESCGPSQLPELCNLPAVQGLLTCTAFIPKWTYSKTEGACIRIVYGGCRGTANLFDTEDQCKAACPSTTTITIPQTRRTYALAKSNAGGRCQLPITSGPCFGSFHHFAYNSTSGLCQKFLFGGCGGNSNNFETKEECVTVCEESQAATCDKFKCPWQLWDHYLAKECVPQYTEDACCPTSFQCPSASESGKDPSKCHYRGVSYSVGDAVPVDDPCSASCTCALPHDPSSLPEVNCANVECPELFRPPRPGCRPLYRADTCCAYDYECADPDSPAPVPRADVCPWQNKTYEVGSKMYFDNYPCQSCICGPGFTGPNGPGCSRIDCGLEFRYTHEINRGCTPIFFESRCCPIGWMCPDDSRIDSDQQQEQQQQAGSTDESAVCHLGDTRLTVGQVLGLTDCKIECRCVTPPELTCVQYRSCEAKQENADQRACPPLECGAGCHPVVGTPGQCPTCSCSSEIFSCPAQTCPSKCRPELDLETGCPSCKCQCPKELECPTDCPSHTVLDEATGCPRCECQPGSPQACPVQPDGKVPCPQDCSVIKAVDENGCEVCKCDPNDPENPFVSLHPPCPGEGEAPCPMDCGIIRRMDENGCEVCECDPDDTGHPFHPLIPPTFNADATGCRTMPDGRAPCPMDCAIIRRTDENGCEVCECDPNYTGNPFGPPQAAAHPAHRVRRSCPSEAEAPCPADCAIIRYTDTNGCGVCKCDPTNPGNPFNPLPVFPPVNRGCPYPEGSAPCPMDCGIMRVKDENGCEVCRCDPNNTGNPFGPHVPPPRPYRYFW
ncbi:hypothetical protein O3P69_014824 [Scylla paramamosain]|uniref:Uncharacterized protein n=1 Tax=Scylla paramamosain TaxID=85552 RepID=A0AAW0TYP8_SCYPA